MKNPFKNKHILAAVIITPILALISFFATDYFVSEKPHAAKEGGSYKLIGRPNCRYTSGVCTLKNGNFMLDIAFTDNTVSVESKLPLQGVKLGINDESPIELTASSDDLRDWSASLATKPNTEATLKLAVMSQETLYFAEQALSFIDKVTFTDK